MNEIDTYHAQFPELVGRLQQIRELIREEAPDAVECICYGVPTFKLKTNLVHYAAYKNHIGFYPTSSGIRAFQDELKAYKTSKGTVQFANNEDLPLELIRRIVRFRVGEVKASLPKKKC